MGKLCQYLDRLCRHGMPGGLHTAVDRVGILVRDLDAELL